MRLLQKKCDLIYDCLDEMEKPKYVPLKHDILALEELLKENPSEKEAIIAFLIHAGEYSQPSEKTKYISKYLYKNLKLVG